MTETRFVAQRAALFPQAAPRPPDVDAAALGSRETDAAARGSRESDAAALRPREADAAALGSPHPHSAPSLDADGLLPPPPSPPDARTTGSGAALAEFGPLIDFVSDPRVTDVFANGPGELWADRGTGLVRHTVIGLDEPSLRALAVRLIAAGGRHIDEATPCVDVRLHDGIRVHAVLPPVSPNGTLLSIRLPRVRQLSVDDLASTGFFSVIPLHVVRELVRTRRNVLLTGAGGSGKTTTLSALLALASADDRIVAIEDVAELRVRHPHFVSLEARQPNLEGAGGVDLSRLVREALRMRPDRLVLGECRGSEIRDLLAALNTGHDGGAGTLHANSLADVPARLEALGALAGLEPTAIARQAVSAIDAVLHLERNGSTRRLTQLGHFRLNARDRLEVVAGVRDG